MTAMWTPSPTIEYQSPLYREIRDHALQLRDVRHDPRSVWLKAENVTLLTNHRLSYPNYRRGLHRRSSTRSTLLKEVF